MPERKTRNLYYDLFSEKYLFHYGMPYANTQADFVQLNVLTRTGPLAARMTLDVFARGVDHYFKSELGVHTLKHLCSQFVPFWRQPLDRFGKPKEKASQVGSGDLVQPVVHSWHPKFLAACWKVAQNGKLKLNQVTELMEQVEGMSEKEAFERLASIGGNGCLTDQKTNINS